MSDYNTNSDKIFVQQLKKKNETAFQHLYEKYRDDIYTYSKFLLHSEISAEEITQEVFLRVWSNATTLNPDLSFKSYIFTITKNLSFDFLRKAANNSRLREEIFYLKEESQNSVQDSLLNEEYRQLLKDAIHSLPPKRKLIFELSRNEDLSYQEISSQLGISVSTVKTQMSKALSTMKQQLKLKTDLTFFLALLSEIW